jgi:hypothetical protein
MTPRIVLALSFALLAGLAGCSTYEKIYQPAEYTPVTELRKGPGLFTGDSGVFTLMGGQKPGTTAGPDAEDGTVVDGKPGEPVVIKRHRPDGD